MKRYMALALLPLLFCSSCRIFDKEVERDDYPRVGSASIIGYDLTLNYEEFQSAYRSELLDCFDDHTAPLSEGYYTTKYKYPIKVCHFRGNVEVEFTDVQSPSYEIKQLKKDYPTKHYPYTKVLDDVGDSLAKRFTVLEPTDLETNRDARLYARQRFHRGVLYLFTKAVWEGKRHKDKDTAEFGRFIYVNDQLENLIQDKLREQREKKEGK